MTAPAAASVGVMSARTVQLAISARLMQDVAKLWPALDPKRLDETWPGWLQAMITLITGYHGQSAVAASRFYRSARSAAIESPTPSSLVKLAPAPDQEWLRRALGYSGPGLLSRDTARPNTAMTATMGTAARISAYGGRTTILNTVESDPVAVGWYRVTDGQPCAFCALLASRGVAYKSKKAAGFASHDHCGCVAAPAFSRNHELPALSREAAEVYRNRGKGDALVAFRKSWAEHLASKAEPQPAAA